VREPQAFLMDEPLSNLDAKLRVEMRAEIARLQRDLGVTTIYVTHDQVEAMTLGDRVAIMRQGVLQQVDSPQKLYDEPANLFVAEFIGSPAMNLVGVDIARSNGEFYATFGEHRLRIPDSVVAARPALPRMEGKRIILGIRPEDLEDATLARDVPEDGRLLAVVDIREDMGSEVFVHFGVGARAVHGEDVKAAMGEDALEARQVAAEDKGSLFVARLDRATHAAEGQRVELAVDTKRLHFFDPATALGIYRED
jgi:multiple sugar transport system ATP-binding protein